MADQLFAGFFTALEAGLLDGAPDIRLMLTMTGFDCDDDAVFCADATDLDEFDGVNYVRIDAANVTTGYEDAANEWRLHCDSDSFGTDVAPGSDVIEGMVARLYIDGTDANDYILGRLTTGGFGVNAANGDLNLTVPTEGLMFNRKAA